MERSTYSRTRGIPVPPPASKPGGLQSRPNVPDSKKTPPTREGGRGYHRHQDIKPLTPQAIDRAVAMAAAKVGRPVMHTPQTTASSNNIAYGGEVSAGRGISAKRRH